ncbi:zinc-ribbon domain-containing protein [Segatella copri]|uniref:zinc ribbon domain-containing protein n=1 Tax=Segatella copri TaxID=165179 RepID=UPI003F8C3731
MKCPICGYPVLPKFTKCPHCGESLVKEDNNTNLPDANDFSIVKGRAIWNVQKGEIAHLIKETELINTDGLKGVIVQEGCTAIVFMNGIITSIMQAGIYSFPTKEPTPAIRPVVPSEPKAGDRTNDFTGFANGESAIGRGIRNFLFGKKKDEKPEQHEKRVERTKEKINKLPDLKTCRIYIVSNRLFNLFFDLQVDEEGNYDFAPFVIATKTVDAKIALSLQMQVTNMNEFVGNYLTDQQSVSTVLFQQQLRTCIKSTLTQLLRNLDYQQDGLPEPIINNLKNRIKSACNEQLYGIEVTKVLDITDESEDFNRFRSAEHDLFVNEKELDYLTRSNEFRNRIEQEKNKQEANQAANAESLRQTLQSINKDKLLSEDEMEQFVMMMDSQKRLREAKTKQEEYEALSDMKKSRLVKEEDIAALENVLAQNKVSRDSIVDLMRAQAEQDLALNKQIAEFKLSDNKKDHDIANELKDALHKGKLASTQLDTKRIIDAYQDERRKKEDDYTFAQQQRKDDYQFQQEQKLEDSSFNRQKRQNDWEFSNQQRQQEADFKSRVQNEDYDFQKQQRQDERDFLKQQRDFQGKVQNDDYEFLKKQRLDEHQFEQDKRKFQSRVQNEDYDFQKMQREQALKEEQNQADFMRQRQNKFDDLDVLERKAAIAQRNMKAMKEAELAELQEKNRSAETMQSMNLNVEMNRDNLFANMTAEQIRAAQLSHLSSEAQAEMAKSYSSEKENELRAQQQAEQKALYEQMMQNQMAQNSQNQEMMMKMAQMMQQGMMGMGQQQMAAQQQRYDDQVAMKQEYRENAMRQQQRTDHTQDSALDNIGRVSTAAASNMNAYGGRNQQYQQPSQPQQPAARTKTCPSCGAEIDADETFCPECGSRV